MGQASTRLGHDGRGWDQFHRMLGPELLPQPVDGAGRLLPSAAQMADRNMMRYQFDARVLGVSGSPTASRRMKSRRMMRASVTSTEATSYESTSVWRTDGRRIFVRPQLQMPAARGEHWWHADARVQHALQQLAFPKRADGREHPAAAAFRRSGIFRGEWGQTEFQGNLKLGLTPRPRKAVMSCTLMTIPYSFFSSGLDTPFRLRPAMRWGGTVSNASPSSGWLPPRLDLRTEAARQASSDQAPAPTTNKKTQHRSMVESNRAW